MATCNICGMKFQIDENIDRKNMEATEVATKGVIDCGLRFAVPEVTDKSNLSST